MKTLRTILLILAAASFNPSWALTLEDCAAAQRHPEHFEQIQNYYEQFRSAKLASRRSGASIASMMLFEEAEQALKEAGFSREELVELNAESHLVFQSEQVEVHKRSTYQQLVLLAETFCAISVADGERRLLQLLADRPEEIEAYESLKKNLVESETSVAAIPRATRLAGNVILLRVLETLGYDFGSKKNVDTLDTFVSNLDEYLLASPSRIQNLKPPEVAEEKTFGDRSRKLLTVWKKAFPRRNKNIEAFKGSRATVKAFLHTRIRSFFLVWGPCMFLPMFTIGELVNPFHLETVGNLIFANDIGFVAGWIIYRISTVLDYLKKNPMVDLNDHHEGGLAMISECESLLREREEP